MLPTQASEEKKTNCVIKEAGSNFFSGFMCNNFQNKSTIAIEEQTATIKVTTTTDLKGSE